MEPQHVQQYSDEQQDIQAHLMNPQYYNPCESSILSQLAVNNSKQMPTIKYNKKMD